MFALLLRLKSEIVPLPSVADIFEGLRDSANSHLLSALQRSGAEVLVSGDHHLLELRGRFTVLSPVEFAARL